MVSVRRATAKPWFACVMRKNISGLNSAERRQNNGNYREFTDKAAYSHAYEGTGEDVVQFFKDNSNYDSLIRSMNGDEREAFRNWTRGWFMMGQQWQGFDSMDHDDRKMTRDMDNILDKATLDRGIVVKRLGSAKLLGLSSDNVNSLSELKSLTGAELLAKGSMSCGAAAQGLTIGQRKNVEYSIRIPGGTTGAGMWIGDHRINGWGADQREFVTNRDTVWRVGKSRYNAERDIYEVELTYMRREKHDYGRSGR